MKQRLDRFGSSGHGPSQAAQHPARGLDEKVHKHYGRRRETRASRELSRSDASLAPPQELLLPHTSRTKCSKERAK